MFLEGIYLRSLIPLISEGFEGSVCSGLGMSASSTLSLSFRGSWLHLGSKPDNTFIRVTGSAATIPPDSPSWEHHLVGARLDKVVQQGTDRVLELWFEEKNPYDRGGARLIFEATGRNANIILVRRKDGRILAALRKVLSSVNRFRTVSPGTVYRPPPSSGHPPETWGSPEVQRLLQGRIEASTLFRNLEGVGPSSARAILECSEDPAGKVAEIGAQIVEGRFVRWRNRFGLMPVKLCEGHEITEPLCPPEVAEEMTEQDYRPSVTELKTLLGREAGRLEKKLKSTTRSLENLRSPDELRFAGNLILTRIGELRKGMQSAVLPDWEGNPVEVNLRSSLTPAENAERYFRKAGKVHLERERLTGRISRLRHSLSEIRSLQDSADELTDPEAAEQLNRFRRSAEPVRSEPQEYLLSGGWKCLAGKNASQNDRLTFSIAGRTDIWLHARGTPGAHVVIRREGRTDNPGEKVLLEAACIAAKHSSSSGIVPVDWTLVKYVRRMKGGGPGQVVYTREKTVFAEV